MNIMPAISALPSSTSQPSLQASATFNFSSNPFSTSVSLSNISNALVYPWHNLAFETASELSSYTTNLTFTNFKKAINTSHYEQQPSFTRVSETADAEEEWDRYGNISADWLNFTVYENNFSDYFNGGNLTDTGLPDSYANAVASIITGSVLGLMILSTVIGNVFVIAAILLERNLQSVANYLIMSLAVADLLVAALVMPLGAVYEVSKEWKLGAELCDMWTASDVLCCTASILHLVAIALDRFWAVTYIDYMQKRTTGRVMTMIVVIWVVSGLISAAPIMGWKDPEWHDRLGNKECLVSQAVSYQIFATLTSFYLPLTVILVLYWRIYQTARKRIRRKPGGNAKYKRNLTTSETTTFTRVSGSPERSSNGTGLNAGNGEGQRRPDVLSINPLLLFANRNFPRRREIENRKERKAAKTLAIITGVFIVCWLPFFILALVMPLCSVSCQISPYLISTFLWLGYFNSALNPVIYTIFSPDFRHAFKRLLFGRQRRLQMHSSFMSMTRATGRS
uniref:5-hydroxytryptamine receptor 2A-like n=1 Tax=Hirondellea gigas TaxID=1518452 RepID=A0A2P2I1E8_9CRUS